MKIIKGPDPITCNNCGCVFEYDSNDVNDDWQMKEGAFIGILPLSRRCTTVICPVCKHKIIIEWESFNGR